MKTKKQGLEASVAERADFLKRVIAFAGLIIRERGVVLSRHVGSCHTNTVSELRNFGDFSFFTDTGQTMFGGNTVKVWYHPGQTKEDVAAVLQITWHDEVENCSSMHFNTDPKWQEAILKLIPRWKMAAKQIDRDAVRAKEKDIARAEEARRNFALADTARRLQVT